jgi:hypothetical protein
LPAEDDAAAEIDVGTEGEVEHDGVAGSVAVDRQNRGVNSAVRGYVEHTGGDTINRLQGAHVLIYRLTRVGEGYVVPAADARGE